jgi:RHS repeat-associated protein
MGDESLRYGIGDHLGSVSMELDANGATISREAYYPYGGTAWWAGRSQLEADYKTIRYSGHERDATGLIYYGLRYYAPWRQRWLNPDPAGETDGLNLFAAFSNSPVSMNDVGGTISVPFGQYVEMDGKNYQVIPVPNSKAMKIVDPQKPFAFENADLVIQNADGSWRPIGKEGLLGGGAGSSKALQKEELKKLIDMSGSSANELDDAAQKQFTRELISLIDASDAEKYRRILKYVKADSDGYNATIRAGRQTSNTEKFLSEFNSLKAYEGKSYRATYVTPAVAKKLEKADGTIFSDTGIQSASTQRINVSGWHSWEEDSRVAQGFSVKTTFIFDATVPQKNLSTGFLPDHVAVAPNTRLKVAAAKRDRDTLYVYFVNAGSQTGKARPIYS